MNYPARLCLSLLLAGGLTTALPAQETPPPPIPEVSERSSDELDDLLGPIALYPDDLVALILPAAAQPTDIVLAARFHDNDGEMDEIDKQPWDESVRALAHFPDLIEWLNKNLGWTQDVGDAFLVQPAEVMKSIQRLRHKAYAAGTLRDTTQQKVLVDGEVIRIVSAEENVVYVPRYRTEVVYVDRPVYYTEPWISFGVGWTIGSWHRWSCDWYSHRIWVFDHHDHWHHRHRHNYYVDVHYNWRHFDHGHAWHPRHTRVHYRHRDRYHHRDRDRYHHRPTPYVEDHSRRWHRNRDRDGDGRRGDRREGIADNNRRRDNSRSDAVRRDGQRRDGDREDRRARDFNRRRTAPNNSSSDPGNVVQTNPNSNTNAASNAGDAQRRNVRTRDRDNENGRQAGSDRRGDRRDNSRGSRPSVSTHSISPAPAVATTPAPRNDRTRNGDGDRRTYARPSRQEVRAVNSSNNREVRVQSAERSNPANRTFAQASRATESSSRQAIRASNNSERNPGRVYGGGGRGAGGGGNSSRASSSDSGKSRNTGDNDKGNNGGRGNGNGNGRGR